jgi:hypothetical protein
MADSNKFTCKRCGYSTLYKANLFKHLDRVNPCDPKITDINNRTLLEELKPKIKDNSNRCNKCNKCFTQAASLSRHKKTCKGTVSSNTQIDIDAYNQLQRTVDVLMSELQTLKTTQNGNTTINNTTINNPTINNTTTIENNVANNVANNVVVNIRNFGDEKKDHITDDKLRQHVLSCYNGIINLVNEIYFNPDVPENNNLRIKSNKQKLLEKFLNGQWYNCDKNNTIRGMLDGVITMLTNFLSLNYEDPIFDTEGRLDYLQKFYAQITRSNTYYDLIRAVYVSLINRQNAEEQHTVNEVIETV